VAFHGEFGARPPEGGRGTAADGEVAARPVGARPPAAGELRARPSVGGRGRPPVGRSGRGAGWEVGLGHRRGERGMATVGEVGAQPLAGNSGRGHRGEYGAQPPAGSSGRGRPWEGQGMASGEERGARDCGEWGGCVGFFLADRALIGEPVVDS
jgi:hypothetical protein